MFGARKRRRQDLERWRMDNPTDLTLDGYLRVAMLESTTSNGVCGIKPHH
jgi:hypothetical protein